MSKAIDKKIKKDSPKQYNLTDFEYAFTMELNMLLQYHVAREQIIENFLTYVAAQRLGYTTVKPGSRLKFEIDGDEKDGKPQAFVKITEVPVQEP